MKKQNLKISQKYKILNEMYKFARSLGVFEKDYLKGIEKDIKLAKIINSV